MSSMSPRVAAAGALYALAAAGPPAVAQVWTPQSMTRDVAASASCQNIALGQVVFDARADSAYADAPIPPVDLNTFADVQAFGSNAGSSARLLSGFEGENVLAVLLAGTGATAAAGGVITMAAGGAEFSFTFLINEPTPVTIRASAHAFAPVGDEFGWSAGRLWLQSLNVASPPIVEFSTSGPGDAAFSVFTPLEPGRYALSGRLSFGADITDTTYAALETTVEVPSPGTSAVLCLVAASFRRRRP